MKARAVNIRVNRLTMTGPRFNRREMSQFRAGFEGELSRLLRDRPLRPTFKVRSRVPPLSTGKYCLKDSTFSTDSTGGVGCSHPTREAL